MHVRRVGTAAWEAFAPAKLNLYLEILGRRADGFHELETLMAPVRLYDRVRWTATATPSELTPRELLPSEFAFCCYRADVRRRHATAPIPSDSSNLAVRATELLGRYAGVRPHGKLEIWKRIPAEAGLGGGSSDAAATLLLLNRAWRTNFSLGRLSQLAAQLGSDVPFFLVGGLTIGRGRGELVEAVAGAPRLHTVVVKPEGGVSTARAFGQLHSEAINVAERTSPSNRMRELISRLRAGAIGRIGELVHNRLQAAAMTLNPRIQLVENAFRRVACPAHSMTGSGSAYFGVLRSARAAMHVARTISALQLGAVYVLSTRR